MKGISERPLGTRRRAGTLRHRLSVLGLLAFVGGSSASATPGCNLAPNPAFENVVAGSQPFVGWAFQKFGTVGAYTASVSTYPSPVQSGAKGAKVVVTAAGDISLATVPEQTAIQVNANSLYRASVRLLSETGTQAWLAVIEWRPSPLPPIVQWISGGGSTQRWETLEGSFTTSSVTSYVSIRLYHHVTPVPSSATSTFYWDDVRLWKDQPGFRCFDARQYVTQTTPRERWCYQPPGGPPAPPMICIDGFKNGGGEFVRDLTNGIRDYVSHTGDGVTPPLGIGVVKNLDPGFSGTWRCFSEDGGSCPSGTAANARFPAVNKPMMASLPVLASIATPATVTPGAQALNGWEPFDVWPLNPLTGAQIGSVSAGRTWQRAWGFFLPSVSFGGDLGTRANVAVFEYEGIGVDPTGLLHGRRLERYYYVQGIGIVRSEGWEDPDCIDDPQLPPPSPSLCDGSYSNNLNGVATFNAKIPMDFQFTVDGPAWVLADWWK